MWNNPLLLETEGKRQIGDQTLNSGLFTIPWTLPTLMNRRQPLCAALYMVSLHEFFWVKMPCNEPAPAILPKWNYICEIRKNETAKQVSVGNQTKCNDRRSIFVFPFCLSWGTFSNIPKDNQQVRKSNESRYTGNFTSVLNQLLDNHYMQILLSKFFQHSIFVVAKYDQSNKKFFQPILLWKTKNLLHLDVYEWKIIYQSDTDMKEMIDTPIFVLNVSDSKKEEHKCHPGAFSCRNDICIALQHVCDGKSHCVNGEDEENPTCFYVKPLIAFCKNFSTQCKYHSTVGKGNFSSSDTLCTSCHFTSVNRVDTNMIDSTYYTSSKNESLYPHHKVCVFDRFHLYCSGISMAANLILCEKHVCLREFKCPESYCVPFLTICDGLYDCPHGEDEVGCSFWECSGKLLKFSVHSFFE